MSEGYITRLALDDHDETIGYEFVRLGKMMEDIRMEFRQRKRCGRILLLMVD